MPRNYPEVGTLPSPCLCSRHNGSAQRLQVHQHRSVPLWFLGCLFLISRCHFEPFSVASSEPLTCVCTHSFCLSDSLATRFSAAVELFDTFRWCGADIYAKWEFCRERTVVFALCVLYVTRFIRVLMCTGGKAGSSLPPSWWRSCCFPAPHQ